MRILIIVSLIGVCCLAGGLILAAEDGDVKNTEYPLALPPFDAVPTNDADKAANDALKAYNNAIKNLRIQLQESKTNAGKTYSIYLLGGLRAKGAAGDLVKIIDFKAEHVDLKSRIGRWGLYPAQGALSKIGSPSVEPIVKTLGKEVNETRRKLMLMVLIDVLDKDVAQFVLQKASKAATEAEKPLYEKATTMLAGM